MPSKIIIITIIALLLVGFSVLFAVEARNHDYDYKKDWVAVYFENPSDNSLDFSIENHEGEIITYNYKILANGNKIAESEIEIEKGAKQTIFPALEISNQKGTKKITIVVSNKDAEYKIYKNIE